MEKHYWREFRERYPELAEQLFVLGAKIYEIGAEKAPISEELGTLVKALKNAPEEARHYLGLNGDVNQATILAAIFEEGSSLLLDYVRSGG